MKYICYENRNGEITAHHIMVMSFSIMSSAETENGQICELMVMILFTQHLSGKSTKC